jgi:hypothetical protein
MKNWKKIAEAHDLRIPETDLERIVPALETLEAAFRPLAKTIPDEIEPAITFRSIPEPAE